MSRLCRLALQTFRDVCGWDYWASKVTKRRLYCQLLFLNALLLFSVSSVQVYAQLDTSTIRGTVTDRTGAVVPGTSVTITDVKTNRNFHMTTNSAGEYNAPSLGVSTYRLRFTREGFKTNTINGIVLHANETLAENSVLEVGAVEQVVEVRANVIQVNTDNSAVGMTITSEQVANIPLNGRNMTDLLALVPGAIQNTGDAVNSDSMGGFNTGQNGVGILLDGTDASRVDANVIGTSMGRSNPRITRSSVDNIQEIKVLSSDYSAEYGRALGDIVNVITKSGSNQIHGELFEFFRNDALDAKNYFYVAPAPLRLNQYGANLGGRLLKDKLFYFGNYEGVRQHVTQVSILPTMVPNAAMRAMAVPAMAPILARIPLSNVPALTNGDTIFSYWFDMINRNTFNNIMEDTGALKLDYVLSSKNNFALRYNYNNSDTYGAYGLAVGQYSTAPQLSRLAKATWNYTGSSTFLNEAGFAFNGPHSRQYAGEPGFPRMDCFIGCNYIGLAPSPQLWESDSPSHSYQLIDTATAIKGRNQFRFGLDIRWNKVGNELAQQDTIDFAGGPAVPAASVNPCTSANTPAGCVTVSGGPEGFLLDQGAGWSRQGYPLTFTENTMMGFFFNDDWKVRRNLSLNLGLRWEHNTVLHDPSGHLQNFDVATLTLLSPKTPLYAPSWVDFEPRIGFNWDVTGNGHTSVKGGFGLFFLPISPGGPLNLASNTEENFSINLLAISFNGATCNPPITYFTYPLPAKLPNCNANAPLNYQAWDRHERDQYAEQWNIALEQQIAKNTVATVTYRGNRGLRMYSGGNLNLENPQKPYPCVGNVNETCYHNYIDDYIGGISLSSQEANSEYNAFNVSVRTNTHGLNISGNYNYTHEYDDFMGLFEAYQNPRNMRADWSRGDGDVKHAFSIGGFYNIPRIPKAPKALGTSWTLTTLVQGRVGSPLNFSFSNTDRFVATLRPDCVPGVSWKAKGYSLPYNQLNINAFTAPKGDFGNCPRNLGLGPGYLQPDFGLLKSTKLTEHLNWEFRIESFDTFNHPNFAKPQTTLIPPTATSPGAAPDSTVAPGFYFGRSTNTVGSLIGQGTSRQLQLSTKFIF